MAERSRDGSFYIMKSMTDKLLADFDHTEVAGLTQNPIITRTITARTPEPYVYVFEIDSNETWVTKTSESRIYNIMAQIVVRDEPGRGTSQQRDDIANQVILNLTGQDDYPDPSGEGYRVQRVTTGDIVKYETMERGGKFYIANIPIEVTAYYHGYDADVVPEAQATYTYSGWEFDPQGRHIENWDDGSIQVGSSYSNSNGWNFTNSSVAKASGYAEGTLSSRTLTVGANQNNAGLTTTFNWELSTDSSQTTTTTDTDVFTRIKSLRYGAIDNKATFTDDADAGTGVRNFTSFQETNREIDFNNTNPIGDTIEVTVTPGDYIYIMYGSDQHNLSSIVEQAGNQNILDITFDGPFNIGGYKYYISKNAANYDNTYTYELG